MTRPAPGKLKKKKSRYHTIAACRAHVGKLDTEITRVRAIIARLHPFNQREVERLRRLRLLSEQLEAKRHLIQMQKEKLIEQAMGLDRK